MDFPGEKSGVWLVKGKIKRKSQKKKKTFLILGPQSHLLLYAKKKS